MGTLVHITKKSPDTKIQKASKYSKSKRCWSFGLSWRIRKELLCTLQQLTSHVHRAKGSCYLMWLFVRCWLKTKEKRNHKPRDSLGRFREVEVLGKLWVLLVLRNGEALLASLLAKRADPNQDLQTACRCCDVSSEHEHHHSISLRSSIDLGSRCWKIQGAKFPWISWILWIFCQNPTPNLSCSIPHISSQSDDSGVLLQLKRWSRFSSGRYLFMETSWSWDVTEFDRKFSVYLINPPEVCKAIHLASARGLNRAFLSLWNVLGRRQKGKSTKQFLGPDLCARFR